MVRKSTLPWLAVLAAALLAPGCRLIEPQAAGKSPLAPLTAMSETVSLEIFFARFPAGNTALNGALWNEIDEQSFPAETRRELSQNGIRAGVVGTHVPVEMARLLTLTDEPRKPSEENTVDLEQEPAVTMRLLAVRPNRRSEVVASHLYDQLSLLTREADEVVGRTYAKAEGRFALRAAGQADGRVQIELLPELQYGEQQQRWNAADGVIRLEAARPKRVFEELRLKAQIAPGQMLVVTCQPERPGSLGYHFFTEPKADALVQKILIIRLAQAGSDRSFADKTSPPAEAPLSDSSARSSQSAPTATGAPHQTSAYVAAQSGDYDSIKPQRPGPLAAILVRRQNRAAGSSA